MNLRECLSKILDEWPIEKQNVFAGNQLAKFIRQDFVLVIDNLSDNKKYRVKASAGAGVWANIPWLSILNTRITTSTQDGVYPGFLFKSDGTGVYLTLNQGTTKPRQELGIPQAREREQYISKYLISGINQLDNWDSAPLNLEASTELGHSYEESNIGSKLYAKESLPSNETLEKDFAEILIIYEKVSDLYKQADDSWKKQNQYRPQINKNENSYSLISSFEISIERSNLQFSITLLIRFISSLQTKPFTILTGLSGSGKTKLAEAFSLWICENPNQICMVAVGADWTNREPLLGFPNALAPDEYVKPESGALDVIIAASKDPARPYFLILDEMNMSHVERYFADFLSAMESTDGEISLHSGSEDWHGVPPTIKELPKNLFIIGTVNIDETTYMFSPKVLDRANVIEFRVSDTEMTSFFDDPKGLDMESLRGAGASMGESFVAKALEAGLVDDTLGDALMPFFTMLQKAGAEFGYRTAVEMSRFVAICSDLAEGVMDKDSVIDAAIMQKLLPKLHGSRNKIESILKELGKLCLVDSIDPSLNVFGEEIVDSDIKYSLSYEKLKRMHDRVLADGFTSFAEA